MIEKRNDTREYEVSQSHTQQQGLTKDGEKDDFQVYVKLQEVEIQLR